MPVGGRDLSSHTLRVKRKKSRVCVEKVMWQSFQCTQYNHKTQISPQFETRLIYGQVPFEKVSYYFNATIYFCPVLNQEWTLNLGTHRSRLSLIVNAIQCHKFLEYLVGKVVCKQRSVTPLFGLALLCTLRCLLQGACIIHSSQLHINQIYLVFNWLWYILGPDLYSWV